MSDDLLAQKEEENSLHLQMSIKQHLVGIFEQTKSNSGMCFVAETIDTILQEFLSLCSYISQLSTNQKQIIEDSQLVLKNQLSELEQQFQQSKSLVISQKQVIDEQNHQLAMYLQQLNNNQEYQRLLGIERDYHLTLQNQQEMNFTICNQTDEIAELKNLISNSERIQCFETTVKKYETNQNQLQQLLINMQESLLENGRKTLYFQSKYYQETVASQTQSKVLQEKIRQIERFQKQHNDLQRVLLAQQEIQSRFHLDQQSVPLLTQIVVSMNKEIYQLYDLNNQLLNDVHQLNEELAGMKAKIGELTCMKQNAISDSSLRDYEQYLDQLLLNKFMEFV